MLAASSAHVLAQATGGTADATIASIKSQRDRERLHHQGAAQVPEDKYKYQPTKDVRTMGQVFGHIANASGMICSTASGTKSPPRAMPRSWRRRPRSRRRSRPHSPSATRRSRDHRRQRQRNRDVFGMTHTRVGAMASTPRINFEHYGNIVTYMRINSMVPPSSGGK